MAHRQPLRIVVTNHHKCWLAARDPSLREAMERADLVVAETSVVWAARVLGRPSVGAAWGVELMGRLLDEAAEGGWGVYLLGARAEVVEALARDVPRRWPGARVAGAHHGYLTDDDRERVVAELRSSAPELLLVAMGSPTQERLLNSLGDGGGPLVSLGVGGSFDVWAGAKVDAPAWLRGSGFEWLYRSLQSPRLLRRYAVVGPWFVAAVLRERLTGRTPRMRP